MICCALLAAGCAKHELTKGDEPLAPSATIVAPSQQSQVPKGDKPIQVVAPDAVKGSDAKIGTASQKDGATKPAGQPGELKKGLEKVYFNFDSADLSGEARNTLVKNAELLKASIKGTIRVEGNCDERGSDDYNLALGEKRAKAAVQYLTNLGLPADRFTTISYGKEKPVAPGHDEASWAKNRMDQFVVVPESER